MPLATSTLNDIRIKVRRLTRNPSTNQLSDNDIDQYVNTFIAYDMPEHLRLKSLRTTLTFYTTANIDTYSTNTTDTLSPLYDFKNKYISIHEPIYIAGYRSFYSQSREQFFNIYPFITYIQQIGLGTAGGLTVFTGTINQHPFLQNNVLISAIDASGNSISYKDEPVAGLPYAGNLVNTQTLVPRGTINYITGGFLIDFESAPAANAKVNAQTVPYQAARPVALLFYQDTFTVRPVPDQAYAINMEAYAQPTQLIASGQAPQYNEWFQYIAYGAAKKVFEDRNQFDDIQQIMPEFIKQEELIQRRTLVQQANERSATIYTEQSGFGSGWPGPFGWWVNG